MALVASGEFGGHGKIDLEHSKMVDNQHSVKGTLLSTPPLYFTGCSVGPRSDTGTANQTDVAVTLPSLHVHTARCNVKRPAVHADCAARLARRRRLRRGGPDRLFLRLSPLQPAGWNPSSTAVAYRGRVLERSRCFCMLWAFLLAQHGPAAAAEATTGVTAAPPPCCQARRPESAFHSPCRAGADHCLLGTQSQH